MKKISLLILSLILLSLMFSGCTTMSFKDVVEPFFEKYGPPTDTTQYIGSRYAFRTWTWWDKKIKVTFIVDRRNVNDWKVSSIYEW